MQVGEAYDSILNLTSEIKKSGICDQLINAAKTKKVSRIEKVMNLFKRENSELWKSIQNFDKEYSTNKVTVFQSKESKSNELRRFNSKVIDPVSMFFLILFIEASDRDLFEDSNVFAYALKDTGNEELSRYVFGEWIIGCVVGTLWNAFYKP